MTSPRWRRLALVLVLLLASGCATGVSRLPDLGKVKPKLVLQPGAFRVVRTVTGRASAPAFLFLDPPPAIKSAMGIPPSQPVLTFGIGDMALRVRAMRDLHRQHDLVGKPQVFHNFIEEWTVANYLGLFAILRVTISADVVEFTGGGS